MRKDNLDPQAFARQVLERALEAHGMSEGYLGPKDPLTLTTVRDVAAELDVPEDFIEEALSKAVVTKPQWKNGYRLMVDRYIPAAQDIVLMEAKTALREHNRLMVLTPLEDGYVFTDIDDGAHSQNPQRLGEYGDVTLNVLPLDKQSSIARLMVQVEHPMLLVAMSILGYGVVATIFGTFVAAIYKWDAAFLRNPIIVLLALMLIGGTIHAFYDWTKRTERIALQMTGGMTNIVRAAKDRARPEVDPAEYLGKQAGGFVTRFLDAFWQSDRTQE